MPLRDNSFDIVHTRFAYFFGPGCEPGLIEIEWIIAPGGTAFTVDNDLRSGTLARWIRESYGVTEEQISDFVRFWVERGYSIEHVQSCWRLQTRDDLQRIIRLEFPQPHAAAIIEEQSELEIDYNLLLMHRTFV